MLLILHRAKQLELSTNTISLHFPFYPLANRRFAFFFSHFISLCHIRLIQASELEREKRMGISSSEKIPKALSEHPVFAINQATNQLLMSKRSKLKTIREKNAEELIKQGKRWEMQRLQLQEQERLKEIAMKRERERKLENQTLYVFDADKVDLSGMDLLKIRSRKFTECEIDLKDFLLSEKEKTRKKMIRGGQSSEDR